MSYSRAYNPILHFDDNYGLPLKNGWLYTFLAGTSTPVATAANEDGSAMNPVNIRLDSRGECEAWLDTSKKYKFEIWNSTRTWHKIVDNVSSSYGGSGGGGGGGVSPSDLKTLTLKKRNRVLGTYSPLEQKSIDIPDSVVYLSEQSPELYQSITQVFASFMVPVLMKSDLDSETPSVTRDFYYWPTARTGTDGDYSFIGYDGVRTEIATVHDDNSVTYTTIEVPTASTASPSMDGIASAGSSTQYSRGDHVHTTDTSREAAANKTTTVRQNGQADNTKFPTEAAVRTAIDSAVSSAYHAAGTKTVAQLTSSLLVSANEGDVYNITDSGSTTSDFIEGAGHPISVGDNVVVCDVGGGVYKFDLLSGFVDLTNYLTKTGDGSDVTASFTAASTRTNVTTGEKLSVLFGKIAKWFSDLKALAFKDKVDTADIENDAITADKVKDNETLPVSVTGSASYAIVADTGVKLPTAYGAFDVQTGYRLLATMTAPGAWNDRICTFNVFETRAGAPKPYGQVGTLTVQIRNNNGTYGYGASYTGVDLHNLEIVVRSNNDHSASIYVYSSGSIYGGLQIALASSSGYTGNPTGREGLTLYLNNSVQVAVTGTPITIAKAMIPLADSNGVGSATQPVYVDGNGEVKPCENRIHDLTLQIKFIRTYGEINGRKILCDRQSWTGTAEQPEFTPISPNDLCTWLNRGDVVNIDLTLYDWWRDKYPAWLVEVQCDVPAGETTGTCTNLRVMREKIVNQQATLDFQWSNLITDEDTNIKYMEFQGV